MNLSRRSFSLSLAAIGLTAAHLRPARAAEKADVLVLGAGLAGLNAAYMLEEQGLKVIVLEADSRVGGRMHTINLPTGRQDTGATTVGPYYARVRYLIDRFKVPLKTPTGREDTALSIRGTLLGADQWETADVNLMQGEERSVQPQHLEFHFLQQFQPLADVNDWLSAESLKNDVSVGEFLKVRGVSDEAIRLIDTTVNCHGVWGGSVLPLLRDNARLSWGLDSSETRRNVYSATEGTADGLTYNYYRDGALSLPTAIAAGLKDVRLNHIVAMIDMPGDGVEVTTVDGKRFTADYVVSAMPITALRNVTITPALPLDQRTAVLEARHSSTIQSYFAIRKPYWEEDGLPASLWTDTEIERLFVGQDEETGAASVMNCWVNGIQAEWLTGIPEPERGDYLLRRIAELRPSTEGALEYLGGYSWAENPFIRCNRMSLAPGQVSKFQKILARPHRRLHIAGEATRTIEVGMEGAAESGERAAVEILDAMAG